MNKPLYTSLILFLFSVLSFTTHAQGTKFYKPGPNGASMWGTNHVVPFGDQLRYDYYMLLTPYVVTSVNYPSARALRIEAKDVSSPKPPRTTANEFAIQIGHDLILLKNPRKQCNKCAQVQVAVNNKDITAQLTDTPKNPLPHAPALLNAEGQPAYSIYRKDTPGFENFVIDVNYSQSPTQSMDYVSGFRIYVSWKKDKRPAQIYGNIRVEAQPEWAWKMEEGVLGWHPRKLLPNALNHQIAEECSLFKKH